jgi:Homeodomain-like domain
MTESTEGLWMSAKERDRLKVLHEVSKRYITQKQAAAELGLSVRWVGKLLVRLQRRGDGGLRHGLRGRASNRKTPEAVKQRAVELYRQKKQAKLWHDYGPTLAAEELFFSLPGAVTPSRKEKREQAEPSAIGKDTRFSHWDAFALTFHEFLPLDVPFGSRWSPGNQPVRLTWRLGERVLNVVTICSMVEGSGK